MWTTLSVGLAQLWRNAWRGDESVKRNIKAEFISGRPPNLKAAAERAVPVRFCAVQPHPRDCPEAIDKGESKLSLIPAG
jgi:hypothetical protein